MDIIKKTQKIGGKSMDLKEDDEDIIYELDQLEDFEELDQILEGEELKEDEFEEMGEIEDFDQLLEDNGIEEDGFEIPMEEDDYEEPIEEGEYEEIEEDDYEEPIEEAEYEETEEDDYEELIEEAEYEEIEEDNYEEPIEEAEYEEIPEDAYEEPIEEAEYEEIPEDDYEELIEEDEYEEIEEDDYEESIEESEYEEIPEDAYEEPIEEADYQEIEEDDYEAPVEEDDYEKPTEDQEYEEETSTEEKQEVTEDEVNPQQMVEEEELQKLSSLKAEYIFLGLLLNNPKAISRYYFQFEDCHFSNQELNNMYRIILFRESEQYAPAIAKEGFKLPLEARDTYSFKMQLQQIASEKNYDIELVYTILKKLFILKKNYLLAPTKIIRDNILNIINYELYNEMTVEEVESAIEQIGVTSGLSQGRLNDDTTNFLLNDESTLATGANLPFPILTNVFKGIRKGETCCYAMPSNSGKSRFTINIASYLAFVEKKKVLIISNEMSVEKMKLCLITTILNNHAYQNLHGQDLRKTEGELLALKFRPDKKKGVKLDDKGFIARGEAETMEAFVERLNEISTEFRKTIATTEWLNEQIENSIHFIHITEHTNDDIRKIIMNYYYKENIEYIFYDTLKADTENIGNGEEVKKTATILSNLAQKFEIFIGSSMQLLESSTLPVNLTINDMSASRTVKEVLDTLCLMKQINPQTLIKYEYSPIEEAKEYKDLEVFGDPDVRYYVCVVDKNRAGAKPKLLFRLNLAYNFWEELGYVRLKQEFVTMD